MISREKKARIVKHFGTLSKTGDYTLELNLVSWCGSMPKIDLRTWKTTSDEHTPMRGIQIESAEAARLFELLEKVVGKECKPSFSDAVDN